jgi:gluconate 2-dehydrogenase gamma chain
MVESDGGRAGLSRRELFRRGGIAGTAVALPMGVLTAAAPALAERTLRQSFTALEADTLEAVLERLVPTDSTGPGAKEAQVSRYIDRALAGPLRDLAPVYQVNLEALDAYAQSSRGAAFAALAPSVQDAVLQEVEAGKATGFSPDSATFFQILLGNAMEGMFGDPYHGGNSGFAGWNLIGFAGIKLFTPPGDTKLNATPKRAHKSTADFHVFNMKEAGA